jgi:hypothetical protein
MGVDLVIRVLQINERGLEIIECLHIGFPVRFGLVFFLWTEESIRWPRKPQRR